MDGETGDLASGAAPGLERSCAIRDRFSVTAPGLALERMEARFHGNGFSPHRHDTYALGLTLHGVQTFSYRGARRFSEPGNIIILHPDEVHDGAAGTEDGLVYRMIYLPPALIAAAGDHRRALPFVADPVARDPELQAALADLLGDLEQEPGDLLTDDALSRITARLDLRSGAPGRHVAPAARSAVLRARDYLESHLSETVQSERLEQVTGLDRYELARQFRRLMGTSPHRYLVMRRLDLAKRLIAAGDGLAEAAAQAGFADQAHFTRHFRKAFGLSPGRWLALTAGP